MATTATIMPSPWFTGTDINNNPIVGGLLRIYDAGTSTPATVWQDAQRAATHAFPIVLDGAGRAVVFLDPTKSYKVRLESAAGVLQKETDLIAAMPLNAAALTVLGTAGENLSAGDCCYLSDGSGALTAGRWYRARANNAYSSTTPVVGFAPSNIVAGDPVAVNVSGLQALPGPLTVGARYYVDPTTPGAITNVRPTGAGSFERLVGQAQTSLSLVVAVNPPPIDVSGTNANIILATQVFS